jgi:hypothetical protein
VPSISSAALTSTDEYSASTGWTAGGWVRLGSVLAVVAVMVSAISPIGAAPAAATEVPGLTWPVAQAATAIRQQAELTPSDGTLGDEFGVSAAISGSTAVVGAPNENTATGAAYVYVRSGTPATWSQQAKLTASDAAPGDIFGISVAISGSIAVVGTYGKASTGAVYVFVRSGTTWSQQAELTASDAVSADRFGDAVAIRGSTIVVGSVNANTGAGAAYVFVRSKTANTWRQQVELTQGADSDFGTSVAISGSTVVVGAPGENTATGAAYVYVRSGTTWSQQARLTASDAATQDLFGDSVAISGSTVLMGAPNENTATGAAYVYVRSGTTWSQQARLTASDAAENDLFGWAVAIHGTTAVVGAEHENGFNGAAYVFLGSGGTWSQQAKLTAADAGTGATFGTSVAISGSTAAIGADYDSGQGTGEAYVFVNV